jgi:hypothetical protein
LGYLGTDGRIILELILKEHGIKVWTGFTRLRKEYRALVYTVLRSGTTGGDPPYKIAKECDTQFPIVVVAISSNYSDTSLQGQHRIVHSNI